MTTKTRMYTEELKKRIAEGHEDAYDLLSDKVPAASRRFYRLEAALAKLLEEVRESYPDAMYYTTGGDGFALLLGESHSGSEEVPNNELMALSAAKLTVQGGDW